MKGGWEGLHGRPRPVPLAHPLEGHDRLPSAGDHEGPPCIVYHHRHPPVSPTSCLSQGTRGPLERASMVFQKDTMWWKPGGVDGGKQYTLCCASPSSWSGEPSPPARATQASPPHIHTAPAPTEHSPSFLVFPVLF